MLKEQIGHRIVDLLLTAVAFLTAYLASLLWLGASSGLADNGVFPFLFLASLVCCGLSYDFFSLYEIHGRQNFDRTFLHVVKSTLAGTAGVVLLIYTLRLQGDSRLLIGLFLGFNILLLTAYRGGLHLRRKNGASSKEILIIGSLERAREVVRYITANEELGYHLIGCLEVGPEYVGAEVAEGIKVIGTLGEFKRILLEQTVDEVVFAMPLQVIDNVADYFIFAEEQGLSVRVLPDWQIPQMMYQPKIASVFVQNFVGIPTLVLSSVPRKEFSLLVKAILDRSLTLAGLLVLSPLLVLIAVSVKVSSKGPVFFRQERCGLNGRKFILYKFRTMVPEAEKLKGRLLAANEMDGPVFKIKNDPRVTPLGKILRRTSMDELPQLINVLRGEMSLVGPRPPLPSEVKEYKHWQLRRLSMKPGLTCIWQVSGRNDVGFEEWMRMDLEYIDRWSLLLDFKLLLKTVQVVILGTGR
ncbi:sugar transferase [Desulfuromonas sp. TF]|uniref:sugar transferase n=1 Tax=Desulfuromonas sp. TF TaxID=1232410 RepID=UPI00041C4792|nr:sugar transferase [Desulfuromonas sp. TF]